MGCRPIGEAAMSDAEHRQRRRDKAKALREAALKPADQHDVVTVFARCRRNSSTGAIYPVASNPCD